MIDSTASYIAQWPLVLDSGIPRRVWSSFIKDHWEKSAALLPRPGSLFPERDVLAAMRDRLKNWAGDDPTVRLIVAGEDVVPLPELAIPLAGETVGKYVDRLDDAFSPAEWTLSVFRLHTGSEAVWRSAATLLGGLFSVLKAIPPGDIDVDAFIGRYAMTPVGIHTDHAANFMFGLHGAKRMHLWEPASLKQNASHPALALRLETATTTVTATSDTMGYMPSSWYHVGETPESPSMTLNVAMFFDRPSVSLARDVIDRRLEAIERSFALHQAISLSNADEVNPWAILAGLKRALCPHEIEEEFLAALLRRLTGYGLGGAFPQRSPIGASQATWARETHPIALAKSAPERAILACNGRSARIPNSTAVRSIVSILNAGEQLTSQQLAAICVNEEDLALTHHVLVLLQMWGAICPSTNPPAISP